MNMPFNAPLLLASIQDFKILNDDLYRYGEAILIFKQTFQTLIGECRNEVSFEVRQSSDGFEILNGVIAYFNLPSQEWEAQDWDQVLTTEQQDEFIKRHEFISLKNEFIERVEFVVRAMPKMTGYVD